MTRLLLASGQSLAVALVAASPASQPLLPLTALLLLAVVAQVGWRRSRPV